MFLEEIMCFNEHSNFYYNLIAEENKYMRKKNNVEIKEKMRKKKRK